MDDLFEAMRHTQVAAVRLRLYGSGATDIVGALSAMGVFDMGGRLLRRIRRLRTSCLSLMLLMLMRRRLF